MMCIPISHQHIGTCMRLPTAVCYYPNFAAGSQRYLSLCQRHWNSRLVIPLISRKYSPRSTQPQSDYILSFFQIMTDIIRHITGTRFMICHRRSKYGISNLTTIHIQFLITDRGYINQCLFKTLCQSKSLTKPRIKHFIIYRPATHTLGFHFSTPYPMGTPITGKQSHLPVSRFTP